MTFDLLHMLDRLLGVLVEKVVGPAGLQDRERVGAGWQQLEAEVPLITYVVQRPQNRGEVQVRGARRGAGGVSEVYVL